MSRDPVSRHHSLCTAAIQNLASAETRRSFDRDEHWMDRRDARTRADALHAAVAAINEVWLNEEARRG